MATLSKDPPEQYTTGCTEMTGLPPSQPTFMGRSIPDDSIIRRAFWTKRNIRKSRMTGAEIQKNQLGDTSAVPTGTLQSGSYTVGPTDFTRQMPGTFPSVDPTNSYYTNINPPPPPPPSYQYIDPPKSESTFGWKTAAFLIASALTATAYCLGSTYLPSKVDSTIMSGVNLFGDTTCWAVPQAVGLGVSAVSTVASTIGSLFSKASEGGGGTSIVSRLGVEGISHSVS